MCGGFVKAGQFSFEFLSIQARWPLLHAPGTGRFIVRATKTSMHTCFSDARKILGSSLMKGDARKIFGSSLAILPTNSVLKLYSSLFFSFDYSSYIFKILVLIYKIISHISISFSDSKNI
jgi:hypothetical protein